MKPTQTTRQAITWGRFSSDKQADGDKVFPTFEVELIDGKKLKWCYDVKEFAIDTKGKFHVIDGGYVGKE